MPSCATRRTRRVPWHPQRHGQHGRLVKPSDGWLDAAATVVLPVSYLLQALLKQAELASPLEDALRRAEVRVRAELSCGSIGVLAWFGAAEISQRHFPNGLLRDGVM